MSYIAWHVTVEVERGDLRGCTWKDQGRLADRSFSDVPRNWWSLANYVDETPTPAHACTSSPSLSLSLFTFNEIAIYLGRCTGRRRMMHCPSSIQVAYTSQPLGIWTSSYSSLPLSLFLSLTLIEIKLAVSRWPEIFGPFIIENATWNYVSLRKEEVKRELNSSIVSYEDKTT